MTGLLKIQPCIPPPKCSIIEPSNTTDTYYQIQERIIQICF